MPGDVVFDCLMPILVDSNVHAEPIYFRDFSTVDQCIRATR